MSGPELDALIAKGQCGELNKYEQNCLSYEFTVYRDMAHRLERAVHAMIKEAEGANDGR